MNSYIGVAADGLSHWDTAFFGYKKTTSLNRPGPGNTFVFIDEGPTINDGFFATDMDTYDPHEHAEQAYDGLYGQLSQQSRQSIFCGRAFRDSQVAGRADLGDYRLRLVLAQ